MSSKYLYMLVTEDEYELPLIVEESPSVLARKCGVTHCAIISLAMKVERGEIARSRYRRVKISDDEE